MLAERNRKDLGNIFYVYIYLDPRKSGKFRYEKGICFEFDYEPFWVGKGGAPTGQNRYLDHLREARNFKKGDKGHPRIYKIKKIWSFGLEPIIVKYRENMRESDAYDLEEQMITIIGRGDLGLGPLTNLTDGGEGPAGYIFTESHIEKLCKARINNCTEEWKKNHSEWMKGRYCGEKNWNFGRTGELSSHHRAVIINGVFYPTIKIAAKELGITEYIIYYRINTGKEGYSYADDTQEDIEARRKKNINKRIRAVTIHGERFPSIKTASEELNISRWTIWDRIHRKVPGYSYTNEEEMNVNK